MSPGIILTPPARDEMSGPGAEGYQRMIEQSASGRVGTVDEIATVAALLLGSDGASSLAATSSSTVASSRPSELGASSSRCSILTSPSHPPHLPSSFAARTTQHPLSCSST